MSILEVDYSIVEQIYEAHKKTWAPDEKRMVHEFLNDHHAKDGRCLAEQGFYMIQSMTYVDGLRKGRETSDIS